MFYILICTNIKDREWASWAAPFSIPSCSATCSAPPRCARCSRDDALVGRYIEAEVALARAQARLRRRARRRLPTAIDAAARDIKIDLDRAAP